MFALMGTDKHVVIVIATSCDHGEEGASSLLLNIARQSDIASFFDHIQPFLHYY